MNRQAAAHIISNTFTHPFDENQFTIFIRNLLNEIDESKYFDYYGNYIPDAFKGYIKRYKRLGTYTDPEGNKIDILTVHLASGESLWRARTTQRNFIAWHLKKRDKDAALVAFIYADNPEDWRFSFVKKEYHPEIDTSGKVRIKEVLTPARRYSFLVGKNEPSHTAQSQLLPLLEDLNNNPTLDEIEKAFSVETVTDRFYKEYRNLFEQLTQELERIKAEDKLVREEFEKKSIDTGNFAKKLLGQIVFLYFLQKKGWLGVGRDERGRFKSWGYGPKDFLKRLYQKKYIDYDNFFNDILEPLFYTALAVKRENDYYPPLDVKVPFLNGGLFDPINGYNWQETNILIDNRFFENLFDTFDTYNFTVCEDEPLEKEVAVDPEMLGKVFENLLPSNLRKGQGAYYTPRTIVHFMCQESLINYLDSVVNIGSKSISSEKAEQKKLFAIKEPKQNVLKVVVRQEIIPKKDIETFIKKGEFVVEYDRAKVKGTKSYRYQLPESIRENARLLDEKLANIKICDPAIGSGAFAVGMMHEIVKARRILSTYIEDKPDPSIYELKRACIQESIYGVDIDPGAIDIAQLRLWLSLVVDEDNYNSIRPLPNLDYKIMQGNSLIENFHGISLNFEKEKVKPQISWVRDTKLEQLIQKLHQKQQEFFNAVCAEDKKNLKREVEEVIISIFRYELERQKEDYFKELRRIEDKAAQFPEGSERTRYFKTEKAKLDKKYGFDIKGIEKELREMTHGNVPRNFFPWKLYFADVFKEKGGFDIVIGNPPYIQLQKAINSQQKLADLYKNENYETFKRTGDIYLLFYEKGIKILNKNGLLCYITSNKWMRASYGKPLRKFLSKFNPIKLIDLGPGVFNTATVDTNILLVSKSSPLIEGWTADRQDGVFKKCQTNSDNVLTPKSTSNKDSHIFKNYKQLPYNPKLKERAKSLRKAGNLAEVLFWNKVKNKQFLGLDFHRQKIIGNYIVDFYCPALQLVVEIDGSSHDSKQEYDEKREKFLQSLNLNVVHFEDKRIRKELDEVLEELKGYCERLITFEHPAPSGHPSERREQTSSCSNTLHNPKKVGLKAITLTDKNKINNLTDNNFITLTNLSDDSWIILSHEEQRIKEKIERIGTPLKEWDINIYRGILTGYNKAFIIDGKTKDELIKKDPKSAEIIKPILRGRDIKRYKAEFADLWLLFIPWHFPLHNDPNISGASKEAEKEFEKQYNAIYNHLLKYKEKLSNRNKAETGIRYEWYALQRCAASYYQEFEKEKIVWKAVGKNLTFSLIMPNTFLAAPAAFLTTSNRTEICYLLANLHSKITFYQVLQISDTTGAGDIMLNIQSLTRIYIPQIPKSQQKPFERLVDKIIAKKEQGKDTTEEERQIDLMVYKLYGLTYDEVKIIDPDFGMSKEEYEKDK